MRAFPYDMKHPVRATILLVLVLLSSVSCTLLSFREDKPQPVAPVEGYATLDKFPFREAWYGMYFQEDKIGYSHFKIEPVGGNYQITSDSVMRLTVMKNTKEIKLKEAVMVRPDLTLLSFDSAVHMNGKDMRMRGVREGSKLSLDITVEGETLHRDFPVDDRIYHTSAISLMPALRGVKDGATYSFGVFNAEKQGIQKVEQHVLQVRGSPGPQDAVWKVKNEYGQSVVQSWLNRKGLTVLEKGLDGSLITVLEDEGAAKKFLETKAEGKDLILDVSLIKLSKPLQNAEKLRYLKVKMQGVDKSVIAQDHRQRLDRQSAKSSQDGFEVVIRSEDLSQYKASGDVPNRETSLEAHLASNAAIQSNHPEIVAQAEKIVRAGDSPVEKINKLVRWTANNVKNSMRDSFSALEVLRVREGQCQSHAKLYTALARSQKIPTRIITGLVHGHQGGFLYHAWAESYVNGWLAVDPTLNQVPADATHVKVSGAEEGDPSNAVLKMMGKVKMEVLDSRD